MLGGEPQSGPGMQNAQHGQPAGSELAHPVPVEAMALAASPQLRCPPARQPIPKGWQAVEVPRYRRIVEVALHDRPQPLSRARGRIVPTLPKLRLEFLPLLPQSPTDRRALHGKVPPPVLPADMRLSRPMEFHHRPLAEPSVRLSPHSAPIRQTRRPYRFASGQRDPTAP